MDTAQMTKQVAAVFKKYEAQATKPWTWDVAAHDLSYQVGSLAKYALQLKKLRYAGGVTDDEIKEKIGDELADIIAEALFIAHELDIDIETAWRGMLNSDEKKITERS